MTLQALAERLRGLAAAAPSPPPPPPSSAAASAPAPPLPASWMQQLKCAPRLFGVAVMRNSMSASLALLTGVLVLDAVLTDPARRRRAGGAPAPAEQQPQQQPAPSSSAA